MIFLKTVKPHTFLKLINPNKTTFLVHLFPLNHRFNSPSINPIYTAAHDFCSCSSHSLSIDDNKTVHNLISIFNRRPFYPDSPELSNFGPKLTTKIVETVLKGFKNWKIALVFFNWASTQNGYKHNCYTYNTMAFILSHARQSAPLRVLTMELVNSRCLMYPGALGFFIRCLGNQGLLEEAILLFDQLQKLGLCVPNNYSYNCLLEAISKSGQSDLIEIRLKEMSHLGWHPDKYTLTPVLQCYCNVGKFDKALDVFNEILKRGWADSYVFSILVLSFSKWGKVDKAVELIESMERLNVSLSEKTFCLLIHGFVREARTDKALQLLDKMLKLGFAPDISLYNVLIGGLCKSKEFEKVLHLYKQMRELGIHPDLKLLMILLSSLQGEKNVMKLFVETREYVDTKSLIWLYNSLLNGLVNNGSVLKAYCVLRAMMGDKSSGHPEVEDHFLNNDNVRPDTDSFTIVINGLYQMAKLDLGLDLFKDMKQFGCQRSLLLYNNLIDGLSNLDRLEECYRLLKEMKELGFKPTSFTHNSIFRCLCRREDVEGALSMVHEMRVCGHDPWTKHSTLLVKKLCNNGRVVQACDFLTKMVQEGFVPDIIAYSAAVNGFLKIQEVDRALELFKDICARGCCPDVVAYNIIINGLCKAERLSEAEDVFNEMLGKGLVPSVVTYNLLIDAWCKNGDMDRAVLCLSRMDENRREPNIITYTTLVDGLCNAGRSDDALVLWDEMMGKGCSPNKIAFMAFISGLCKCGRPDKAFIYFREMENKQMIPDTFVYVALIEAFLSISNAPTALDILGNMVQHKKYPDLLDKSCVSLRDAVLKLSEDARTSSSIKNLLAESSIPTFLNISHVGNEGHKR